MMRIKRKPSFLLTKFSNSYKTKNPAIISGIFGFILLSILIPKFFGIGTIGYQF